MRTNTDQTNHRAGNGALFLKPLSLYISYRMKRNGKTIYCTSISRNIYLNFLKPGFTVGHPATTADGVERRLDKKTTRTWNMTDPGVAANRIYL